MQTETSFNHDYMLVDDAFSLCSSASMRVLKAFDDVTFYLGQSLLGLAYRAITIPLPFGKNGALPRSW